MWLPAWEDPALRESEWPVLGDDWAAASEALEILRARARCRHGRSLAARCAECAAEVAETLARQARAGAAET